MHYNSEDQKVSRKFVADIMANRLDHDARLTKHLIPEFSLGCRRMTPGSNYLESLTKENVEVVTQSVVRMTEEGVVDESGIEHKVDVVICATGFDVSFTPHSRTHTDFPLSYTGRWRRPWRLLGSRRTWTGNCAILSRASSRTRLGSFGRRVHC